MKKLTRWSPDTCKCEIDYAWDTDDHEDHRRHTIVSHKHCGEEHPVLIVGEILEDSAFLAHHKKWNNGQTRRLKAR
jgi:hypothetical protein